MHSKESGSTWSGEYMPSAVKARRPFRLDSKPWAMELGGAPQSNAHLTVPHAQYVGQDCAAQSYAQAVSSSQLTLQGGSPYPTWSAPPPYALQGTRRMAGVLRAGRSPETFHAATSLPRPSASPPAAHKLPKTSPVSYEEAVRIAWAQPCPTGVLNRGDSTPSKGYPIPHPKSVDEILPAIRAEAKAQEGMRGFAGSAGSSEAAGCGLLEDVSRMANDGQMDLIPLDQMSPRSAGTTAADCDVAHVDHAASSKSGAAEENAANLMMDGNAEGQSFGEECNDSSGSLSGPPHKVSPIPAAAWYRKLCEIPGCNTQPSYGKRGTSRPLFCSRHKKEGMVGLKNRPCLYPGCSIRPHYGLPGGRAFYCTSHKKGGMVHLLKEITTRAKLEKESKLVEAGGVLIKRKRCPYGTGSYARRTRAVEIAAQAGQGSVCGKTERGRGEAEPESEIIAIVGGKGATGSDEGIFSRGPGTAKEGKSSSPALTVTVSPSSPVPLSSRSNSTPLADEGLRSPTEMCAAGFATPPSTRFAQNELTPRPASTSENAHRASTGPPSWETTLDEVRRARDTDGTCRRARAPSRKAMEASGKVEDEGVQWMTKEKREEQARLSEKLKRQRRAAAAAGLKAGEVLEEYNVPTTQIDAGAPRRREADLSCDGSDRLQGARKGPQGRSGLKASTTERTPEGTKTQHPTNVANRSYGAAIAGRTCAGALCNNRNDTDAGGRDPARGDSIVSHRDALGDSKRRRSVGKKKREEQAEQAGKRGDNRGARGYRSRADLGKVGASGRNATAKETKCEFQTCSKMATFGVNLTVRYCELHRLFGMHEIAGKH